MVDRIERTPSVSKTDLRLQPLITSPYVQQQLQLAGLINHRSLSRRKYQRQDREAITHEIVLRALKIDENHRRSRFHQFEVATRRVVNKNFQSLSKQHKKQSQGRKKAREKSAPGCLTKPENVGEGRLRVSSAYNRQTKANKDLSESNHEQDCIERLDKPNVLSVERHACEITMSYIAKTIVNTEKPVRDEVVVMQQHSTGEHLVVFRGLLAKGESFSFNSQRRPTSALSLAFYAKGFIDSVVNDCCEFKYSRRLQHANEHSNFLVQRVRKVSRCEKCRRKYSQRAQTPNPNNTSVDTTGNDYSQKVRQRRLTPTLKLPVDYPEQVSPEKQNSSSKRHHENKKESKKHSVAVSTVDENENKDKQITNEQKNKNISSKPSSKTQINTERSASIDFCLLESTLVFERKPSTQLISTKSSSTSPIRGKSTKHSAAIIQGGKS